LFADFQLGGEVLDSLPQQIFLGHMIFLAPAEALMCPGKITGRKGSGDG
jgi:hypothetical protein